MPDPNNATSAFQLLLTPEKAALVADGPTTLRVLVRMQAPIPRPERSNARRCTWHWCSTVPDR